MKKQVLITVAVLLFATLAAWSQGSDEVKIPLIGDQAPSFTAESSRGTITFPDDYGRKWKILFSHPKDFTPVCSTELLELANLQADFADLNTAIVVLSTDNLDQHKAWIKSLEDVDYCGHGQQQIKFPVVDDQSKVISREYGMIHPASNTTEDVRGVFIIGPDNTVESIMFYPSKVGRNMEEVKRTLVALQTTHDNVVTPANWEPGKDLMLSYLNEEQKAEMQNSASSIYQLTWFMTFKRP